MNSSEIKTESDFYKWLVEYTQSEIYWDRIEPKNESGYPDADVILKKHPGKEVRIELKVTTKTSLPIRNLMQPSQLVSFLEYSKFGGDKRWMLVFSKEDKIIRLYRTSSVRAAVQRNSYLADMSIPSDPPENFRDILVRAIQNA